VSEKNGRVSRLALISQKMTEDKKALLPFERTYKTGDIIFSQGETGTVLFVVHQGDILVTRQPTDWKTPAEIMPVGQGGIVGGELLFGASIRNETARAKADCVLWEFTKEQFVEFYLTAGEMAYGTLRALTLMLEDIKARYLLALAATAKLQEENAELRDAGWASERDSREHLAARVELERTRTEIIGLRSELKEHERSAQTEYSVQEAKYWTLSKRVVEVEQERDALAARVRELAAADNLTDQEFAALKPMMRRFQEERDGLEALVRELKREQKLLLETLEVAKKRGGQSSASADEAVRQAFERIDALEDDLVEAHKKIAALNDAMATAMGHVGRLRKENERLKAELAMRIQLGK